ncbi:MAG TPA: hypothetical protein VEY10_04680, partial [Flavisolibacter sp.]|nr:hypothetical protein [Flavisolibacter sp.]
SSWRSYCKAVWLKHSNMKRNLFCAAFILCLLSCSDSGTKNAMQKDTVVMVTPTTNNGGNMDTTNAGSTINGGTNSSGATNMNSSGTTTTGRDTGKSTGDNH